jgi:hypothetical protein
LKIVEQTLVGESGTGRLAIHTTGIGDLPTAFRTIGYSVHPEKFSPGLNI